MPGASMRTFATEARRIEQACDRGELMPAMLSDALTWWLYTNRTRRRGRGDTAWRPRAFLGGTYGDIGPRRVAFPSPAVVASEDAPEDRP